MWPSVEQLLCHSALQGATASLLNQLCCFVLSRLLFNNRVKCFYDVVFGHIERWQLFVTD